MEVLRLDKFLSSQLLLSRTDVKKLIKQGRITVNGLAAVRPEDRVDPNADAVALDGNKIEYKKYIYIMLNKPAGVVSASNDKKEQTVVDLVPAVSRRPGLFPAGRLDKDSTGFVLITDDGAFAHEMLSPAHHVKKTYTVQLEREVTPAEEEEIRKGIRLETETFRPAELKRLGAGDPPTYEIVLTEGKYHEIKRTFGYFGNRVVSLHRTRIGGLALDEALPAGACRELTPEEVRLITENI